MVDISKIDPRTVIAIQAGNLSDLAGLLSCLLKDDMLSRLFFERRSWDSYQGAVDALNILGFRYDGDTFMVDESMVRDVEDL